MTVKDLFKDKSRSIERRVSSLPRATCWYLKGSEVRAPPRRTSLPLGRLSWYTYCHSMAGLSRSLAIDILADRHSRRGRILRRSE